MKYSFLILFFFSSTCLLCAQEEFTLNIHEMGEPDGLNPMTSSSANGEYIQAQIFMKLLNYNTETFELEPQLAVARPEIEFIKTGDYKGGMSLTYEIHPKAQWDDGRPVTAYDYIFSLKVIRNSLVKPSHSVSYFEFIDNVVVDSKNDKKFTIYSKEIYFKAEESSGLETAILPEHLYDPEGMMKKFSLKELGDLSKVAELGKDEQLIRFAKQLMHTNYQRSPEHISGCGAYMLDAWEPNSKIVLKRKKSWWADQVKTENTQLKAYPNEIVYRTINDINDAVLEAKNGKIDIIRSVHPETFFELNEEEKFAEKFAFLSTDQFAYHYIGFNTKNPKLSDARVRRAIAHCVDRDKLIDELFEGYAEKVNTPISRTKKYYNDTIKDIEFDLDKALKLLEEAGWDDKNRDGVLEKQIGNERISLRLEFLYNQGHSIRKRIGMMLQKNLKKIGVELNLKAISFGALLDLADKRDFELIALAWVKTPGLEDMKQVWHTDADTDAGANRVGFGNENSDRIIDAIRATVDEKERLTLYHQIQEIIVAEQPYLFLAAPRELIIIRKGFKCPRLSAMRPGYSANLFQWKKTK